MTNQTLALDSFLRSSLKTRHLALILALDEQRSIGKVATLTHRTQPAVSKALSELEAGLGLALFSRTARGLVPTLYGDCLIRHARELQANVNNARDELRGLAIGTAGRVKVGVLAGAATVVLPRALAAMKHDFPHTAVLVREGSLDVLVPELRNGDLDLIIGTLSSRPLPRDLAEERLIAMPAALISRKDHPIARVKKLTLGHLRDLPWVFPPIGTVMRAPLEALFEAHDFPFPNNVIETVSIHVISAYVGWTDAVAVIPLDVAERYSALGVVRRLQVELPELVPPIGMIWSRERNTLPGTSALIESLKKSVITNRL